jgi:hypothetical protein
MNLSVRRSLSAWPREALDLAIFCFQSPPPETRPQIDRPRGGLSAKTHIAETGKDR